MKLLQCLSHSQSPLHRLAIAAFLLSVQLEFSALSFAADAHSPQGAEPPAAKAKPLRLAPLIQEAVGNNSELKALKHEALEQEAQIDPAGAYADPKIQFEFSNVPVDTYSFSEHAMTGRELRLIQQIPFPGKLSKKERAASHAYMAAKFSYDDAQLQLIEQVKTTYYELYFIHRQIEIALATQSILKQFTSTANSLYRVGKGLQQDVLKAQVQQSEIEKELLSLRRELGIKEADLNVLLDREAHVPLGKPVDFKITPVPLDKLSMHGLYLVALEERPRRKSSLERVKSAEAFEDFRSWDYFPDFEFGAKYRFRESNRVDRGTDFFSGYVGISIPLFFFGKQSDLHTAATQNRIAAEARDTAFLRHLSHHVHHLYLRAKEARELVEIYEKDLLPRAEQALKSAELGYEVDKVDFITLLNNERALFRHRIGFERAKVQHEIAIAKLESAVGAPFSEWVEKISRLTSSEDSK